MNRRHPVLLGLLTLAVWAWPLSAEAQQSVDEFAGLSLQELLATDLVTLNVLGTHTHLAGEWMLGYRVMVMDMPSLRSGTKDISESDVLRDYMVSPTDMTMTMHMVHAMYAPSNKLTFMAMAPYVRKRMSHVTRMGARFTTVSEGQGDLRISARYTTVGDVRNRENRLIVEGGISVPTGSIDARDDTTAGPNRVLPYPMQLGSGTFDILSGLTYSGESRDWAWLVEGQATLRTGRNSRGYALGNEGHGAIWVARKFADWVSPSVRIDANVRGNIRGADPDLNRMMAPTADPSLRAGRRITASFALNLFAGTGRLQGNRLALATEIPVIESLDGPQLASGTVYTLGWSWTF